MVLIIDLVVNLALLCFFKIVGDSDTNCIERLYVNHYKRVFVYDPRLAKETLSEFMERYNNEVDDVMYMMCYTNLADKLVAENLR